VNRNVIVPGAGGSVIAEPDGRIDLALWYRFEDPPIAGDSPDKTFVVRLLPNGSVDSLFNASGLSAGSITLGEFGISDHSFNARAVRLRSGDLVFAGTQFDGAVSTVRLVRIAFDAVSVPGQIVQVNGPAQPALLAYARRLGVVVDP
jgi:hypothetical protein